MSKDIRTLRVERNVKLRALAKQLEVSTNRLNKWERGFEVPTNQEFERIARVLDYDAQRLQFAQLEYIHHVTPGEGYTTVKANDFQVFNRVKKLDDSKLKVLDLFCGVGGFSYGFEMTGKFITSCGIDLLKDRVVSFHKNHLYADSIVADIRKLPIERIVDHSCKPDVILGGPPCQGFSSIRPFRTLTEEDKRNTLFEYFLLIINAIRPRWFIFENVVGLLSHDAGKTFPAILQGFKDAGYIVNWRIINAANFGVPQNRERIFVVGNSAGRNFEWPEPTHFTEYKSMAGKHSNLVSTLPLFDNNLKTVIRLMDAIGDLPEVKAGQEATAYVKNVSLTEYARQMRNGCERLSWHCATAHTEKMIEIIRIAGKNRYELPDGVTSSGFSSCYSRLDPDKPSTTITVNFVHPASNRCIHPYQDRALTPREGARIQGFPDNFEFCGTRTQVVKQIGNAVSPLVARALANALQSQF